MQLINSGQQRILNNDSANERWKQTFALEKAQDEIALLREQISSLQQYLSEQLQQQQVIEQELHETNQELELMNVELQQLVEAKRLFLERIREFSRTLPADGGISRKALTTLLNFYDEITYPEELEPVRSTLSPMKYAAQKSSVFIQ